MTARHIYVDETKERGYVLVASVHIADNLSDLRKTIRGLVLRGQTRVHMAKESDPRRRAICAAISPPASMPPSTTPASATETR